MIQLHDDALAANQRRELECEHIFNKRKAEIIPKIKEALQQAANNGKFSCPWIFFSTDFVVSSSPYLNDELMCDYSTRLLTEWFAEEPEWTMPFQFTDPFPQPHTGTGGAIAYGFSAGGCSSRCVWFNFTQPMIDDIHPLK